MGAREDVLEYYGLSKIAGALDVLKRVGTTTGKGALGGALIGGLGGGASALSDDAYLDEVLQRAGKGALRGGAVGGALGLGYGAATAGGRAKYNPTEIKVEPLPRLSAGGPTAKAHEAVEALKAVRAERNRKLDEMDMNVEALKSALKDFESRI